MGRVMCVAPGTQQPRGQRTVPTFRTATITQYPGPVWPLGKGVWETQLLGQGFIPNPYPSDCCFLKNGQTWVLAP